MRMNYSEFETVYSDINTHSEFSLSINSIIEITINSLPKTLQSLLNIITIEHYEHIYLADPFCPFSFSLSSS